MILRHVASRERDVLARFSLEAVGNALSDVDGITNEEIATRIAKAAHAVVVGSTWHRTFLPEMVERSERFVATTGAAIGASAGNKESWYQMAHCPLEADELLVFDFDPPPTRFWDLTSATIWRESHRFLTDPASQTLAEVQPEADGRARFIAAAGDPGRPNWIKTFGHARCLLKLPTNAVSSNPDPVVRRIGAMAFRKSSGTEGLGRRGRWDRPRDRSGGRPIHRACRRAAPIRRAEQRGNPDEEAA